MKQLTRFTGTLLLIASQESSKQVGSTTNWISSSTHDTRVLVSSEDVALLLSRHYLCQAKHPTKKAQGSSVFLAKCTFPIHLFLLFFVSTLLQYESVSSFFFTLLRIRLLGSDNDIGSLRSRTSRFVSCQELHLAN